MGCGFSKDQDVSQMSRNRWRDEKGGSIDTHFVVPCTSCESAGRLILQRTLDGLPPLPSCITSLPQKPHNFLVDRCIHPGATALADASALYSAHFVNMMRMDLLIRLKELNRWMYVCPVSTLNSPCILILFAG